MLQTNTWWGMARLVCLNVIFSRCTEPSRALEDPEEGEHVPSSELSVTNQLSQSIGVGVG